MHYSPRRCTDTSTHLHRDAMLLLSKIKEYEARAESSNNKGISGV